MYRKAGLVAAGLLATLISVGPALAASGGAKNTLSMVATAYGPTAQDNYPYGATDYFGRPLVAGDVAVDPHVIPLKTCLYITGYRSPYLPTGGFIGEADDEGGAIQGNRVDLFINGSESQVNSFGIQRVQVTILGPATNPSASGSAACAGYAQGTPQALSHASGQGPSTVAAYSQGQPSTGTSLHGSRTRPHRPWLALSRRFGGRWHGWRGAWGRPHHVYRKVFRRAQR
jgi:3D (Asp-Asp-Asp) domain-containing protein